MKNIYQEITDKIIQKLEQGVVPWRKPWTVAYGMPMNFITKRAYRGINVFLLSMSEYSSNQWASFKQVMNAGGKVKRGEKGTMVVLWKMIKVKKDEQTDEEFKLKPVIRYYHVFNVEQCEGLSIPNIKQREVNPITSCEEIINGMPLRPRIVFTGSEAFYKPVSDHIQIPQQNNFKTDASFYETIFHELTHATGHPSRLNRKEVMSVARFGSKEYSKEELTAEMGAAFLCGTAVIDNITLSNSASYIQSWLNALNNDNKLLIQAAGRAQKAVDYILNKQFKPDPIS